MESLAAVLIAFIAAVSQAVTGFGFALILVPLLSLVYDPQTAVVVSLSLGLASKAPLLILDRKFVQLRLIVPLTAAAFVGVAAGVPVLLHADPSLLRVGIGLTVVVLAALLLGNVRWSVKRERLASLGVGLVSGMLTGSTSMGGPPVVLFGVNQAWAKESMRANLVAFFTATTLFSVGLLAVSGALTRDILLLDALMLPGVALGLLAGNVAFRRVPREVFYRVMVLFVIATGIVGVLSGARGLLG